MATATETETITSTAAPSAEQLGEQLGHDQGAGTAPQASDSERIPAAGERVFILAANSVATGETREILQLIAKAGDRPGFQTMDGEVFYLDERGEAWRFPTEADLPPRRCTVPVEVEGELLPCAAILAKKPLECAVCSGSRCFPHCGGIDHFPGRFMARGGSLCFEWRTREVGSRFFMAQLYRVRETEAGRVLQIVETVGGVPGESYADMFRRFEALLAARISADSQAVQP